MKSPEENVSRFPAFDDSLIKDYLKEGKLDGNRCD